MDNGLVLQAEGRSSRCYYSVDRSHRAAVVSRDANVPLIRLPSRAHRSCSQSGSVCEGQRQYHMRRVSCDDAPPTAMAAHWSYKRPLLVGHESDEALDPCA